MKPFEAETLHPFRSPSLGSGDEVERCSNRKDHRRSFPHPKLLGNVVLLRCAKSDPEKVSIACSNRFRRVIVLGLFNWPEGRRGRSGDPNAVLVSKPLAHLLGDARGASKEEVAKIPIDTPPGEEMNPVGCGDSVRRMPDKT